MLDNVKFQKYFYLDYIFIASILALIKMLINVSNLKRKRVFLACSLSTTFLSINILGHTKKLLTCLYTFKYLHQYLCSGLRKARDAQIYNGQHRVGH